MPRPDHKHLGRPVRLVKRHRPRPCCRPFAVYGCEGPQRADAFGVVGEGLEVGGEEERVPWRRCGCGGEEEGDGGPLRHARGERELDADEREVRIQLRQPRLHHLPPDNAELHLLVRTYQPVGHEPAHRIRAMKRPQIPREGPQIAPPALRVEARDDRVGVLRRRVDGVGEGGEPGRDDGGDVEGGGDGSGETVRGGEIGRWGWGGHDG